MKDAKKIYLGDIVQSSLGEVIVLDIQDNYLIIFKANGPEFVKANGYEFRNNKLIWSSGEYYSSLTDLIDGIEN